MNNNFKSRKLNRLEEYNYSQEGWYFVTICVNNKIECLGKIENEKMILSEFGRIAGHYWREIPNHYKNVFLDEWIIMPNHIHGIIVIDNNIVGTEHCSVREIEQNFVPVTRTGQCPVPTTNTNITKGQNYGLLSKIIKSFKEITVKNIRRQFNNFEFSWQRSFYDHVIRDEESLFNIREYIINNPLKWGTDRNNPENFNEI